MSNTFGIDAKMDHGRFLSAEWKELYVDRTKAEPLYQRPRSRSKRSINSSDSKRSWQRKTKSASRPPFLNRIQNIYGNNSNSSANMSPSGLAEFTLKEIADGVCGVLTWMAGQHRNCAVSNKFSTCTVLRLLASPVAECLTICRPRFDCVATPSNL